MAGEYIEFNNNSQPAINDTNLNRLQQLIKQDIQGAVSGDTLPVGVIVPYGSNTIPENWLLCDGSAVSRETYQDLFNTIGTTYGAGDGFTTFNLPDLQGKVVVGKDDNDTDFDTLGETGGNKIAYTFRRPGKSGYYLQTGEGPFSDRLITSETIKTESGVTLENVSSMQPYEVQNYIIKAFQSSGVVAEVVQTQTNSDEDVYSCNYINNLSKVLYNNDSGTTGNITLSQSANNFSYLMIYWKSVYNGTRYGVEIAPNNSLYWTMTSTDIDVNNNTVYTNSTMYYINQTSINVIKSDNYNGANSNEFYITKVVGYK